MRRIVFASNNAGKLDEIRFLAKDLDLEIVGMKEAGIDMDIPENGNTFLENSMIKAKTIHRLIGGTVMADDSGLCIDALGGIPGIMSARFFGTNTTYKEKFAELNRLLTGVPLEKRTAKFICAITVICEDNREISVEESMSGILLDYEVGANGFGYDPIFFLPEFNKTAAQLSEEEKNAVSHRGKAFRSILAKL
jgi:XTP/dITP diphosphohydrolase